MGVYQFEGSQVFHFHGVKSDFLSDKKNKDQTKRKEKNRIGLKQSILSLK